MPPIAPPRWSPDEFERDRLAAIEEFRSSRAAELLDPYNEAFEAARQAVAELLELTVDLSDVVDRATDVVRTTARLEALRYLSCPPISSDDLKVLANVNTLAIARLPRMPSDARRVVETVVQNLDPGRFPWVRDDREPTPQEVEAALVATASMIAQRRVMTKRANDAKDQQEQATRDCLIRADFRMVDARTVSTNRDAPRAGEFFGTEANFFGRKADVVVTLRDGRFMPIECKVSNSSTNSVKRLNNDAAAKAEHWIDRVGTDQTIPTAVLSGVFKAHNLANAQSRHLTIFWAQNLGELETFLKAAV